MYLILSLIVLFVTSFLIDVIVSGEYRRNRYNHHTSIPLSFVSVFSGVFLLTMLLFLPLLRYVSKLDVEKYKSKQITITEQRASGLAEYERATLIKEIIDSNAWLAGVKTNKNRKLINWYYVDEVLDLEPIK